MTKLGHRRPAAVDGPSSAQAPCRPSDLGAPETRWSQLMCRARAPQLLRDHRRRFKAFEAWCKTRGARAVPASPELLGDYLLALAPRYRWNTLRNVVSAIAFVHRLNGLALPTAGLRTVWRTIARQFGGGATASHGLTLSELELLLQSLPATRRGARDRALLLIAFWGGLRAAQLVGLDLRRPTPGASGVVEVGSDGIIMAVGHAGTRASPPRLTTRRLGRLSELCPVAALEHWLQVGGIVAGPIFRRVRRGDRVGRERLTSPNLSRLVRRIWRDAIEASTGLDPGPLASAGKVSFRSFRTGFIVSAIESGISEERIALHLGWRTTAAVQTYRDQQQIRRGHPVCAVAAPRPHASTGGGRKRAA